MQFITIELLSLNQLRSNMIRSRLPHFIHFKSSRPHKHKKPIAQLAPQPSWFEQFYNQKQTLAIIHQNNSNIARLSAQYEANPTIYTLKQLEKMISNNCEFIYRVDRWINMMKLNPIQSASYGSTTIGDRQVIRNICQHFELQISEAIMAVFQFKQRITVTNNELDKVLRDESFVSMASRQSHSLNPNYSFSVNATGRVPGVNPSSRQLVFEEVSAQIQNLNLILRRMNAAVASQGELVNRIDENLLKTHHNTMQGTEQLSRRLNREQGTGEFSFQGRINKAIMSLYIVNILLIVAFLLKNILT